MDGVGDDAPYNPGKGYKARAADAREEDDFRLAVHAGDHNALGGWLEGSVNNKPIARVDEVVCHRRVGHTHKKSLAGRDGKLGGKVGFA